jgi:mannan polymerase II complex MNN11 subunit
MPIIRRSRVQFLVLCTLVIGTLYYFFSKIGGGEASAPPGTPPVVVVTVVEPGPYSRQYLDNIKQNRIEYAKKHGV